MNENDIVELLTKLQNQKITLSQAVASLKAGPFLATDLEFANIDHHRRFRQGMAEVVYGESKTTKQVLAIAQELYQTGQPVLLTRLNAKKRKKLKENFKAILVNDLACTAILNPLAPSKKQPEIDQPFIGILAAGTSDLAVAEEAVAVCQANGVSYRCYYDVGVAGLHRLLKPLKEIQQASALVVTAGMEGALPSVVAGLVAVPVFAVPTSVGYGASFNGLAALLAMLNSCASGVSVVNIDNGFSAAVAACRIIKMLEAKK